MGLSEVWVGGELSSRLLVLLRWLAAVGQGVTLFAVWKLGVEVPLLQCACAVLITLLSNAVLKWWLRQIGGHLRDGFFHVLLWDALTLTILLHWTGGLENPFTLFYLVQLTLAAVALRTSAVIGLGVLMMAGCVWLWLESVPLRMQDGSAVSAELMMRGAFTALVLAGSFILTLLLALRRRSHRLQKERERLRAELESRDRFLSVAALATGFAHELATPLGTIALAVGEMKAEPNEQAVEIIAREVARCQGVLQRLRELGQEATGQSAAACDVAEVVKSALNDLAAMQRGRVRLTLNVAQAEVTCAGLHEALLVLLRNALLSSADDLPVLLIVDVVQTSVRFTMRDRGPGFTAEMLRHWGEPFRSTRENGAGMGLGLFFVRRLAASMHGTLEITNQSTGGACVVFSLPLHSASKEAA